MQEITRGKHAPLFQWKSLLVHPTEKAFCVWQDASSNALDKAIVFSQKKYFKSC